MKTLLPVALLGLSLTVFSQQKNAPSPLSALQYGVVLDHPDVKKVLVKPDVPYLKTPEGALHLDLYFPPDMAESEIRPAIVFLNAIGERPGQAKVKSWGIYSSWPRLMAAHGYVGISMESDGEHIQESIQGVFDFITAQGKQFHIDPERLGVYAASANVNGSAHYLMQKNACPGIKAAVLYYGNAPEGPYRKDLPVFFVISEGDVRPGRYEGVWQQVLKNNAPWTIKMGTSMPHAFDAFSDNDEARKIVKETISFWKNQLDPIPAPTWPRSKGRDVLATMGIDRNKGISLLKSLTEEYPADPAVLLFYANALSDSKQTAEAEGYYKKVVALEPQNGEALVKLAALNFTQNKTAEAEKYVAAAASSGPLDRHLCIQLGYALLVANKNAGAAGWYEKALAQGPNGVDYYNLACAYAKDGLKEKAFPALEKAIQHGFSSKTQFENDPDLAALKADARFKTLLEKTK